MYLAYNDCCAGIPARLFNDIIDAKAYRTTTGGPNHIHEIGSRPGMQPLHLMLVAHANSAPYWLHADHAHYHAMHHAIIGDALTGPRDAGVVPTEVAE